MVKIEAIKSDGVKLKMLVNRYEGYLKVVCGKEKIQDIFLEGNGSIERYDYMLNDLKNRAELVLMNNRAFCRDIGRLSDWKKVKYTVNFN